MGSTSCPGLLSLNSSCPEFSSHIPQSSCFACLPTAFPVVCSEAELCLLSPSSFSNCLGYFRLLPWVLGEHQVARSTLGCQGEHLQWPEPHLGKSIHLSNCLLACLLPLIWAPRMLGVSSGRQATATHIQDDRTQMMGKDV